MLQADTCLFFNMREQERLVVGVNVNEEFVGQILEILNTDKI